MDPVAFFLKAIDPLLISPFRWFEDPVLGWWIGNFVLALAAVLVGELSSALAYQINRRYIQRSLEQTNYFHEQSIKAKQSGDEKAYKGINRLATEELGKSFFLLMAMGMASLWPAFLSAAWLDKRFGHITFTMPEWAGDFQLSFLAPFILQYIVARIIVSRLKPLLPISILHAPRGNISKAP